MSAEYILLIYFLAIAGYLYVASELVKPKPKHYTMRTFFAKVRKAGTEDNFLSRPVKASSKKEAREKLLDEGLELKGIVRTDPTKL